MSVRRVLREQNKKMLDAPFAVGSKPGGFWTPRITSKRFFIDTSWRVLVDTYPYSARSMSVCMSIYRPISRQIRPISWSMIRPTLMFVGQTELPGCQAFARFSERACVGDLSALVYLGEEGWRMLNMINMSHVLGPRPKSRPNSMI